MEILDRRRRVSAMWLKRVPTREIAATLKVTPQTITTDIKWLKKDWAKEQSDNVKEVIDRELQDLDHMEQQAASIHTLCMTQFNRARRDAELEGHAAAPDARPWLAEARQSLAERRSIKERRSRLIGLDAPVKQEVQGDVGLVSFTLGGGLFDDAEAEGSEGPGRDPGATE